MTVGRGRDRLLKRRVSVGMRFGLKGQGKGSAAASEAISAIFRMDCRILGGGIRCSARPSPGRDLLTPESLVSSTYFAFRVCCVPVGHPVLSQKSR